MDDRSVAERAMEIAVEARADIKAHMLTCERIGQINQGILKDVRESVSALVTKVEQATHGPAHEAGNRNWAVKLTLVSNMVMLAGLAALHFLHLN